MRIVSRPVAGLLLALPFVAVPAHAQSVEQFYKGKQIVLVVAGGAGGGYDRFARLYGRYAGKHIPGNPTFVAKNNPAAFGLVAANTLFNNIEPDGLTIAALTSSIPLDPLFKRPGVQYDAQKLNWIGSIAKQSAVCGTGKHSAAQSVDAVKEKEVVVGAVGATSNGAVWPKVLNEVIGTKFKVVSGYPEGGGTQLALERGEIDGICGMSWSTFKITRPNWVRDKQFKVLLQMQMGRHADLPNIPSVLEFVTDPDRKRVLELLILRQETGNPIAAPPGVPADRLEALRRGFDATMKDPEFLAEAAKEGLDIEPLTATEIDKLLASAYSTAPAIVERAKALVEDGGKK